MREPENRSELQEAVDQAGFQLLVDSAVKYGLIEYSDEVNVERCEEMLQRGKDQGLRPARSEILCQRYIGRVEVPE